MSVWGNNEKAIYWSQKGHKNGWDPVPGKSVVLQVNKLMLTIPRCDQSVTSRYLEQAHD